MACPVRFFTISKPPPATVSKSTSPVSYVLTKVPSATVALATSLPAPRSVTVTFTLAVLVAYAMPALPPATSLTSYS